MKRTGRTQGGFGMLWALAATSIVFLLLCSTWALIQYQQQSAARRIVTARLQSLAQSGMHFGLAELNRDPAFAAVNTETWSIMLATPSTLPPRTSPDFGLETRQKEDWRTISVHVRLGASDEGVKGTVRATYHPRYPAAILATEALQALDLQTDSFDATKGNYRQTSEPDFGNLWSFGWTSVELGASSSIRGDCQALGDLHITGDLSKIGGSTRSLEVGYPLQSKIVPPDAIPLTLVPGRTRRLSPGRYFIDHLILTDNTRLFCEGRVELYVNEAIIQTQAITSVKEDPWATKVYVTGHRVDVACPFTGIVDAPHAQISISGPGDFYGAVLGKTVTVGPGVFLHFDRSLPNRSRGARLNWKLLSWHLDGK